MGKKTFYDDDARSRVLGGAELLYNAVKTTLGPKGRNAVIGSIQGRPVVTHDGVTVAKNIDIDEDSPELLGFKTGADLIKDASSKMEKTAGDGTTTVTILTYHLLKEANRLIAAGHNPMLLRKELEAAAAKAIEALKSLAEPINNDPERIAQVGSISAGDSEIGKLIADIIETIGRDGMVTVEAGHGLSLEAEVVEGYTFDSGYLSPYMVTDQNRKEAIYKDPAIIVTDKTISSITEFLPLLEKLAISGKKDVLLIADDVTPESLSVFIINKMSGIMNIVAVKAPEFGDRRKEVLNDIAILTGAQMISDSAGTKFEDVELDEIGSARKVIVTSDSTSILEGRGEIADHIKSLADQAAAATNEYEKENLDKRRAALAGKIAVIKVGGQTETEIDEKKFRVDDAVAAVKAALDEGIVSGGAITPLALIRATNYTDDGSTILCKAFEQPFRILMANSDINADEWLPKIYESEIGFGVDVLGETKIINLKDTGVIDPVRVTREAIQNAVSIAGTAMTMGVLVVDVPEAKI